MQLLNPRPFVFLLTFGAGVSAVAQAVPPMAKAPFDRASYLANHGYWQLAIQKYEEALAIAPQAKAIWLEYVAALRQGNRLQQALRSGWRLVELDSGNCHAWSAVGATLVAAGEYEAAFGAYDKAASLSKDKAWGLQNLLDLGRAQSVAGDPKGAVRVFERATKLEPKSAKALVDLAIGQAMIGDKEKGPGIVRAAIAQLDKANDPAGKDVRSYAEAAVKRLEAGKPGFAESPPNHFQLVPDVLVKQPDRGRAMKLPIAAKVDFSMRLSDTETWVVPVPETWAVVVAGSGPVVDGNRPLELTIDPVSTSRCRIQLTYHWRLRPKDDPKKTVEEWAKQKLSEVVEPALPVEELETATAHLWYYQCEIRGVADIDVQERERARYGIQGVSVMGNVVISFGISLDDVSDKVKGPVMKFLQGMSVQ